MKHLPELETQRLLLRPAHPRLARAAAAYYARNEAFCRPLSPRTTRILPPSPIKRP